ncbi:MAG TPA: glycosyltransferase family 4 protein [Ktedonobacteraceae bacterium]|nr:glycosyltransferase family 4 protein [Ktedonobacteraceae bacterium]
MRILMLAQFYPPTIGGEERHVRNLSLELATRGHHVSVATLWHKGDADFEMDQGVRIHRIRGTMQRAPMLFSEKGRRFAPPFPDLEVMRALRRVIKQEHPDVVHAHNWIVHSFTPIKSWSKAKLVVTLHDYSLVCAQKRLTYQDEVCSGPTLTKCLKCATDFYGAAKGPLAVLANSAWGKRERQSVDMFLPVSQAVAHGTRMAAYGVPYRVIPNFVPDNVSELRNDDHPLLGRLPNEDFLLFVGDVRRDKGVEVLLRAYAKTSSQVPLVLIGRPGNDLSLDFPPNVRMPADAQGWPHEAVMSAWSRCAVALAPSIWPDPCPTVAMEAMSMGRPVIASRIGGLSDIIADGETGMLVTAGDPEALSAAIQSLLADPQRRCRMGTLAKQRVAEFQAKTVVPCIEQVYQEIVQPQFPGRLQGSSLQ